MLSRGRVVFLLGAGVSIPAGMPKTSEISKAVLSGLGFRRHTDSNYYLEAPVPDESGLTEEYLPRVLPFLRLLATEIDHYYTGQAERSANYEDLHYVAGQIHDSEMGEYDNPVVGAFITKIWQDTKPLLIRKQNAIRDEWRLADVADEATNYIQDVVWRLLSKQPGRLDHLLCLRHACLDHELPGVDVVTLNHDRVIEQSMDASDIRIVDGFRDPLNRVRYWDPALFDDRRSRVRLLKLHGSIDWFRLRPDGGTAYDDRIGIPPDGDHMHARDPAGHLLHSEPSRPLLLIGRFNKMLQYTSGFWLELFWRFHRFLQQSRRLVISGYSFGDKGINTQLAEWMFQSPDHRAVVIHPQPERLKKTARGAISNNWQAWVQDGKLLVIRKKIEDAQWSELKGALTR